MNLFKKKTAPSPAPAEENAPPKKKENWVKATPLWTVGTVIAILLGIYHFYTSFVGLPQAYLHRGIHMMLVLILAYLSYGGVKNKALRIPEKVISIALLVVVFGHILVNYNAIQLRSAYPTGMDIFSAVVLVALITIAAYRYIGKAMAMVIVAFLLYASFGYLIPGRFSAPQLAFSRMCSYIFNSNFALFGSTTGVAATSVVMFVFFGAFLSESGAMKVFSDLSIKLTRKITGGPAKASIIACALVGMIQGNSITNVATTGTFAIPLMKRSGYDKEFAAAVEAAAATGGMIMPPVMGAAAFLMAEFTSTAYSKIVVYAIIPALLYYLGIFFAVHFRAKRQNLTTNEVTTELDKKEMFWQGMTCLGGFVTLVVMLVMGYSATRCALISMCVITVIWLVRPIDRLTLKKFLKTMESGGRGMLTTSVACIGAGIVIGCIGMSGLGIKLSVIASLAKANVYVVLFLVMVVCIILGMGLPVSASYILAATTMASVMMSYNLELVPVHMFLMYFATMSAITPPVALASYASAGIADANPNRVGWKAVLLVLPAFAIPYIFVISPELLMIGNTVDIILATISAICGVFAFVVVTEGYIFTKVTLPLRIVAGVATACLIIVGVKTDLVGYALMAVVIAVNYMESKRQGKLASGTQQ